MRSTTARALGALIAAAAAGLLAGCTAAEPAPPAPCPPAIGETFGIVGAVETDAPDPALYPAGAPAPSCSFYFEPQDSTSVVIVEADAADFDSVASALEGAGYELSERTEDHDPAPGDAHLQVELLAGPASGVLMLVEPDPGTGFDTMSVVLLAVANG